MSVTPRPTSSRTSRTTHVSSDSPASTNPARTDIRRSGHVGCRASSTRSAPSWTSTMIAGSDLGHSSCPVASDTRDHPAADSLVGEPSRALKRALRCQFSRATAVTTTPAEDSVSTSPKDRRSVVSPPSDSTGTAHRCRPSALPRNTASVGGASATSVAGTMATAPSATGTRPTGSTRSTDAVGHPAVNASESLRSSSARSSGDRDSMGSVTSAKDTSRP